jgi:DNA mismatch repair protein MutS2
MQAAALRALEFDRIRELLAREALTPLGEERALALEPAVEPAEVDSRLATTSAAAAFAASGGSLAVDAPDDLPEVLAGLDIADQPLDPAALLGLARFLTSVDRIVRSLDSADPLLARLAAPAASFEAETAAIAHAIDPGGDVSDRASPALAEIRETLRRQRAKLRASLDALTRGRDTAKYLQDQIVTDRNGRYVVVVRAEHREAVAGIVHGTSASGASLYVEPLSTVPLNNDIVALAERERAEIRRILLALTRAFRVRGDELAATVDVAAEFDELYAKVQLARRMTGVAPRVIVSGDLELVGARHPLLIPAVRDLQDDPDTTGAAPMNPVASDLRLTEPTRALVISGPNTGGKTVALKAFGLLSVMAQAGLLIPVEPGSRFTPFRSVFADIGDDQSIAASLSTFSGHIASIVAMERALELPALVLLDEIGGGTDPVEGGALGAAIVDHFRQRGALVVATTHDDTLKSYAATTPGVATAGFGFNPETYAPTYRLLYGAPGRSLALEIADRLGMPASVIADARARRTGRESQLAAHLARMDEEMAALEREREAASAERAAVGADRHRLLEREARLTEREAVLKRRLDQRVHDQVREARAEVDRIVGQLKQRADSLADRATRLVPGRTAISTGDLGALRAEARAALSAIDDAVATPDLPLEQDEGFSEPPAPGQSVFVVPFGAQGVVRAIGSGGSRVEVEVNGKRMQVPLASLRRRDSRPAGPDRSSGPAKARVQTPAPNPQATELMLIGSTVDQALDRAAKFLDDALVADARRLRVVHGHGTGKLREALRTFFREHPLVASVSPAPDNEGGNGATVVELRD